MDGWIHEWTLGLSSTSDFLECTSVSTATSSTAQNASSITMTFNFLIKTYHLEKSFPNQPTGFLTCSVALPLFAWNFYFLLYLLSVPFKHFAPVLLNYCKPSMSLLGCSFFGLEHSALFLSPFHQLSPFFSLDLNLEAFPDAFVPSLSYMILTWTLRTHRLLCPYLLSCTSISPIQL